MRLGLIAGSALALALLPLPARCADAPSSSSEWQFTATPYLWLPGIYGQVTARGLTSNVSTTFKNLYNHTDTHWGLLGEAEAWKGDFGGFANINYLKLGENNIPVGPFRVDGTSQVLLFGFGLFYHLGDWYIGGPMDGGRGRTRKLRLEASAGGRYTNLSIDLDLHHLPGRDKSVDWADPVIGGRATIDLTEHINALIQADVGGTSTSSDFTWSAMGLLGYRFAFFGSPADAFAGYRTLVQNYAANGNQFRWNVTLRGPILGMTVQF